jgi:hypothetical protein
MNEFKFIDGARVVFHGMDGDGSTEAVTSFPGDFAEVGKTGTVTSSGYVPRVRMDSGYEVYGWGEDRYELAPERVLVLGVGSKVRALVDECDLRKGAVYTVKEVYEDTGSVIVLDDAQDDHCLYAHEYEIVPARAKFNEGDFVLIARKSEEHIWWSDEYMTPNIGKVGRVVSVGTYGCAVVVDGGEWNYEFAALEPVQAEQPAAGPFLIAGMTTEYPTLEAAEAFLSALGDNGKEYTITQVVARRRVTRTTTLETC